MGQVSGYAVGKFLDKKLDPGRDTFIVLIVNLLFVAGYFIYMFLSMILSQESYIFFDYILTILSPFLYLFSLTMSEKY